MIAFLWNQPSTHLRRFIVFRARRKKKNVEMTKKRVKVSWSASVAALRCRFPTLIARRKALMRPAFRPNASFAKAYVGKTAREPKRAVLSSQTNMTEFQGSPKSGATSRPTRSENHGKSGPLGFWNARG